MSGFLKPQRVPGSAEHDCTVEELPDRGLCLSQFAARQNGGDDQRIAMIVKAD